MNSYSIYKTMCDIANKSYPIEEYPDNKFTKFFIEISPKELKSKHGHYEPDKKKIVIFNLSRPNGHIIATTIHELAHHIDCCMRGTSDHSKTFYSILQHLIITAIGMGVMTKDNILSKDDSADRDRLEKIFGDINSWDIPNIDYKQDMITIKVYQSFSIKDKLKNREYKYNASDQTWIKEINSDQQEDEIHAVSQWIDSKHIKILKGNTLTIETYYYLCVSNCFDHKQYLKENAYMWNGYGFKKVWVKKISSQQLKEEQKNLQSLKDIKVKVISKK